MIPVLSALAPRDLTPTELPAADTNRLDNKLSFETLPVDTYSAPTPVAVSAVTVAANLMPVLVVVPILFASL